MYSAAVLKKKQRTVHMTTYIIVFNPSTLPYIKRLWDLSLINIFLPLQSQSNFVLMAHLFKELFARTLTVISYSMN